MLDRLKPAQLDEWEAFHRIDPINSEWRSDYRMAYMASLMINVAIKLYGKKGAEFTEPKDFMPEWDEEQQSYKPQQSIEEMGSILKSFAKQHNKTVEKRKMTRDRKPLKR